MNRIALATPTFAACLGMPVCQAHSSAGSSIITALDRLTPYAGGKRRHQKFVHASEPFDIERRQAGLTGYDGTWDPHNSAALYAYAAQLLPKHRPLAERLGATQALLHACAASGG